MTSNVVSWWEQITWCRIDKESHSSTRNVNVNTQLQNYIFFRLTLSDVFSIKKPNWFNISRKGLRGFNCNKFHCRLQFTQFYIYWNVKQCFTIFFIVCPDNRITTPRVSQHFSCVVLLPEQDLAPIFKTSVCYGSAAITYREYRLLFYPDLLWLCTFGPCVGVDVCGLCPAVHVMFQVHQYSSLKTYLQQDNTHTHNSKIKSVCMPWMHTGEKRYSSTHY